MKALYFKQTSMSSKIEIFSGKRERGSFVLGRGAYSQVRLQVLRALSSKSFVVRMNEAPIHRSKNIFFQFVKTDEYPRTAIMQ